MIKALVTDVSSVLLFLKDKAYLGSLNGLYRKKVKEPGFEFFNSFELNEELIDFYKTLNNKIDVHILTRDVIQDDPALKPFWEGTIERIFSAAKMNTEKTKPEAYEMVLKELKLTPKEVLYVDDNQINVEAAKKVGLKTVWYKANEQVVREINNALQV